MKRPVVENTLKKRDLWVLIFITPAFIVLLCYWLFGPVYFRDPAVFTWATASVSLFETMQWRLHIYADHLLRNRFPLFGQLAERLGLSLVTHACIMIMVISTYCIFAQCTNLAGFEFQWENYLKALLAGFCMNLSSIGFHEGVYLFHNWRKTILEAEELKMNNLRSQLVGLKSQVNPHFLFNSMNTLSSLIQEDGPKAEVFLNEMSKVYRYLLQIDRNDLTALETELSFIGSWFYILKTRYGKGVELDLDIRPGDQDKLVPILTLMTIIENILSFNVINKADPLKIVIRTADGNRLMVGNLERIKKGNSRAPADKGLDHLMEKYRLMGHTDVFIDYRGQWRWLVMPLVTQKIIRSEAI